MVREIYKILAIIALIILFFSTCKTNSTGFTDDISMTCKDIFIDTSDYDVTILFKINISNEGSEKFYLFSNSSIFHRDSIKSNFYLLDTTHHLKYQLILASGPSIIKLYPGKSFKLPLLMIQMVKWEDLKKIYNKRGAVNIHDSSLIIEFLRGCKLIHVTNKKDFKAFHIKLKYLIKDTVPITLSDSTFVYFAIPNVKIFVNDSLFKQQHPRTIMLKEN